MAKKDSREDREVDYLKGSQESVDAYIKVQQAVQKTKDELENLKETQESINGLVDEATEKEKELLRLKQVSTSISKISNKHASDEAAFKEASTKSSRKFYEGLKSANAEARTSEAMEARMKMLHEQRNQLSQDASGKHAERNAQQISAIDLAIRELEIKRDISAIDGRTPEQLQRAADAQRLVVNLAKEQLETYKKVEESIKSVKDAGDSVIESFSEKMSEVSEVFKNDIPIVGKFFGGVVDKMSKSIKEKLEGASKKFMKTFTDSVMSGKSVMQSLSAATQGFGTVLTTVMRAAIPLLALSALAIGFERFHKLEKSALSFKTTTGLAGADVHKLSEDIRDAQMATASLGTSMADVSDAMATLRGQLQPVEEISNSVVKSMIVMQKNFGVTYENAAAAQQVFKNIAGMTDEAAQAAVMMATEMASAAGLSANEIVGDIAEATKSGSQLYTYMKGSGKEIAQAAVEAKLMGSSLEKMAESAKTMLDFEQGIENELSAIAITGQNMNFGMARELAAAGDLLGMEKEIARQLGGVKDISKMNAFEREAMAKATGKSVDELITLQKIEKKFPGIKNEQLAAAKKLEAKYGDISNLSKEDLDRETERLKKEEKMNGVLDQMKNRFAEIGMQLADTLVPLGKILLGVLEYGILPVLSFMSEMVKTIIGSFSALGNVLTGNFDKVKGVAGWLQAILGTMLVIKGVQIAWNAAKAIGLGYTLATKTAEGAAEAAKKGGLITEYAFLAISKAKVFWKGLEAAWEAKSLAIKTAQGGVENASLIRRAGIAIMTVISSLASIPFIGWALGIAAAATIAGMVSKYKKAGDVMSPADGKTRISTKEGGLYELSDNDDLIAAPGIANRVGQVSNKRNSGDNSSTASDIADRVEQVSNVTEMLNKAIKQISSVAESVAAKDLSKTMVGNIQLAKSVPASVGAAKNIAAMSKTVGKVATPIAIGGTMLSAGLRIGEGENVKDVLVNEGGGLAGALTGATAGAAIGSIIPGIGTAIGGVVGGLLGSLAGDYFTKKEEVTPTPMPMPANQIPSTVNVNMPPATNPQAGYQELLAEIKTMNKNLSNSKPPVFQADSYRLTAVIANANASNPITTKR